MMDGNSSVEDKVRHLEQCLDNLRSEVDLKMQIMEQILNTRNEQFVVQKKLIEKEHALYESVLTHWKSRGGGGLSSLTGQSTNFNRYSKITPEFSTTQNSTPTFSFKRTSSSATFTSDSERPQHRAKRFRTLVPQPKFDPLDNTTGEDSFSDMDNSCVTEMTQDINPHDTVDFDSGGESDDGECDTETVGNGMEKKVFVNFYSVNPCNPEDGSSDPIWLHFLHEEKGSTALCKHCDNLGFQKIYQLKSPGFAVLRTHLKRRHKIAVETPPTFPTPEVPCPNPPPVEKVKSGPQKKVILRHNDRLYQRYHSKNMTEYWRCNQYETCAGKLIRRNGGIVEVTQEHSCLTSPADCDASEFRDKIREMAETHPTVSASDIIAAAKAGYSQEVLDLVPKDDSLRRTIRRIRLSLESAASCNSDWAYT